jgi:hypothetical protein
VAEKGEPAVCKGLTEGCDALDCAGNPCPPVKKAIVPPRPNKPKVVKKTPTKPKPAPTVAQPTVPAPSAQPIEVFLTGSATTEEGTGRTTTTVMGPAGAQVWVVNSIDMHPAP